MTNTEIKVELNAENTRTEIAVKTFINIMKSDAAYEMPWGIEDLLEDFATLPAPIKGHILLQMMGRSGCDIGQSLTHYEKKELLEIASVLGVDHAQDIYKIAVFLTKVA